MNLTAEQLANLIEDLRTRRADSTEVEVKLGVGGVPTLGTTLCAFGNMPTGGVILIGLDESTNFAAVGVPDPAGMEGAVASQARTAVAPPVQVTFAEALIDDAVVVIATVAPLPPSVKPARYQGNAYLRQADGDYIMSEQEVLQLLAARDRPRYDAAPVPGTSVEDLDPDLTSQLLGAARRSSARLRNIEDEEILRRKRVLVPKGPELTIAGLYALGSYPQQFDPNLSITAAVQLDPRTGSRTRDLVHLDGPIPALLDDAMDWVTRNTRTTIRYRDDGHARDVEEIPAVAVREFVANALVHRDLSPHTQSKRVEIRLTNDLLVINNPGGLWGINRSQLGSPAGKSAVNEFLYDLCKLVRTPHGDRNIEGEGGGVREAQFALRDANLRQPRFVDKGVSFTVLISRDSLLSNDDLEWLHSWDPRQSFSDVQRRLAVSMRHGQEWTNARVREEFAPIDSTVARAELQGLVNAGLAETQGQRGQTTYSLASDRGAVPPPARTQIRIRIPDGDHSPDQPELPFGGDEQPQTTEGKLLSSGVTKQGPAVIEALDSGARTVDAIVRATGLSLHQVRYALDRLTEAGLVDVVGGWGVRGTTYQVRSAPLG